jgi:hypothetical protein
MRVLLLAITALSSHAFVVQPQVRSPLSLHMADGHETVEAYKSAMSNIRTDGGNGEKANLDVIMKFGGSSLANFERIDHVANLIKNQIAAGYRPRAVVCSAMGKTTNNLLSAGDFALGKSDVVVVC